MTQSLHIKQMMLILSILCLTTHSCIDTIELDVQDTEDIIIIDGSVYSDGTFPEVRVRKGAAFASGPDGVEFPISGAHVEIAELGGSTFVLDEIQPGTYSINRSLGTTQRDYQLKVQVNGETYESSIEQMPVVIPIQELSWTTQKENIDNTRGNVESKDVLVVRANADLSGIQEDIFLRYRIDGTWEFRERSAANNLNAIFCYITERVDLNNLALIDGREVNNGILTDQPILEEFLDFRFAFNYCFTVTQQSISNATFNYWKSIQNEFERTGDIFESPPARIKGNIFNTISAKNDVIGIFSSTLR